MLGSRQRAVQALQEPVRCELDLFVSPLGRSVLARDPDALRKLLAEAGFDQVELSTATIEANFAAETFVEDLEYPYGVLVPGFLEDPDAFVSYVSAVREQSRGVLDRYRRGDRIVFETPANLALARRPS